MRHFNQRTELFLWKMTVAMAPIDLKEAIFHKISVEFTYNELKTLANSVYGSRFL